ncbi:MAG: cls [Candidatus Saccharibacteria bacterium]|jgi:cardiolipin synthase|nr:cls [Candidatus Saccharibacteria bacterium]
MVHLFVDMDNPLAFIGIFALLIDWIIRIAFVLYVPRGRKPTAAMAWLLAILIIPVFGVLLFLIIGSPKLSKRRRHQQQSIDALIETATRTAEPVPQGLTALEYDRYAPLIKQNKELGKLPAHRGNTVDILDDYQSMIDDTIFHIHKAERYVYIEYFIIAYDKSTIPFFNAIEDAVERGVDVYVLFDAVGSRKYIGYRKMTRKLTKIGAKWHRMLPLRLNPTHYNRPDLRNHRKIVVIDGTVAYLGSFNMIERTYQRKDTVTYDELVVRMTGPVVNQCAAIFAGDWFSETGQSPTVLLEPMVSDEQDGVMAQVLPSGPAYDHENNLKLFVSLLYTAKHRVVITNPYFVPDDALLTAVISAVNRGVEVVIINSQVKDQWMVGHAQRSYYQQLLEAGVKIYLHNAPRLLHSKHVTVDDDIAVVGSSNMDIRSFQLNLECVVVLYDTSVVKKLQRIQQKNIANAHVITLDQWNNRPFYKEFLDSIARLTAALQ